MAYATPTDTLFRFQTYLSKKYELGVHPPNSATPFLDMMEVWQDYRGSGVRIGVVGSIDKSHYDLRANYEGRFDGVTAPGAPVSWSTWMAGFAAADDNGRGLVGVAPDATVLSLGTSYQAGLSRAKPDVVVAISDANMYSGTPINENLIAGGRGGRGSVVIVDSPNYQNLSKSDPIDFGSFEADASHTGIAGDRHVITAAGLANFGGVAFGGAESEMMLTSVLLESSTYLHPLVEVDPADYDPSKPYPTDPTIMIVAGDSPAILGLDVMGAGGNVAPNRLDSGFFEIVARVSLEADTTDLRNGSTQVTFANGGQAGVLSGVVATMLEANPRLGWRDVQTILSHASGWGEHRNLSPHVKPNDPTYEIPVVNAGTGHNLGGLAFSQDFGFGQLNGLSAVRLAETWIGTKHSGNEANVTVSAANHVGKTYRYGATNSSDPYVNIPVDEEIDSRTFTIGVRQDVDIESIELDLDAFVEAYHFPISDIPDRYAAAEDFKITVTSPGGTEWVVVDAMNWDGERHQIRRDLTPQQAAAIEANERALYDWRASMTIDFDTRRFAGESSRGAWKVTVERDYSGYGDLPLAFKVEELALTFHGAPGNENDLYVFNNDALKTNKTGAEYVNLGNNRVLTDAVGNNVINAAAMTDFNALKLTSAAGTVAYADGARLYSLGGNAKVTALFASDGNDQLRGSFAHATYMSGGRGNDTYIVTHARDQVVERGGQGNDRILSYVDYTMSGASLNVEAVNLIGNANLRATGSDWHNRLVGNGGRNLLDGRGGNDVLNGLGGADTLAGGAGNDTYVVGAGDRVWERPGAGTDQVNSAVTWWLGANLENLVLTGRAAINGIGNGQGNRITGNNAGNALNGKAGNDVLVGKGGNDALSGGAGSDILAGGAGLDRLYGGADGVRDVFVFRSIAEAGRGAARDQIFNFRHGIDDIDLRAIDANAAAGGNQAFRLAGKAAPNAVWTVDTGRDIVVRGDVNGDRGHDFEIRVISVGNLGAVDFLL